jgi:parallel beta-helix repeat protein
MIKRILTVLIVIFYSVILHAQEKTILAGMKITRTTTIKKGVYKIDAADSLSKPVIVIEGDNITVDFNNAELKGSNKKKSPDQFFGIAILIRNGKNIVIRNLKAKGYKIALLARNVEKLTLDNCDFSYNYRPHLNSTQEKEDVSDWMSYHHNEKDEWLRYGAAIYLRKCNSAAIRNCRVTGGQNALMLTECNSGKIYNNDFSFNSGIGIGLYRCNGNEISYNKIDFNVRGYSHGVYSRGQDSAGILVYEQSNQNIFYKNSATHSGDGFFLWAGQTTMDTGEGGCNENVIIENDFSYAPANGVEATFGRNRISGNRIFECDYGVWGGYSYYSRITNNKFRDNRVAAIAIEHGQHNEISYNLFSKDKEAIRLWSKKEQPADWGYAKYRDTRSADYTIAMNSFNSNPIVINATRTDSLKIFGNTYADYEQLFKFDSTVSNIDTTEGELIDSTMSYPSVKNPADPFKDARSLAGRKNILITEWGPYDFRSPVIWNTNPADTSDLLKFDLLGSKGKWTLKNFRGVKNISAAKGKFPAAITAQRIKGEGTDILIELEYKGASITSPFGEKWTANTPYKFVFKKFFQPIKWEVLFFSLDTARHNPLTTNELFSPLAKMAPFKRDTVNKIDYAWWGGIKEAGIQHQQFITLATGRATIPEGNYELSVTWDDAVRVYIDDKMLIDEWKPSKYTFDESPNRKIQVSLGGDHWFRIEHLELGGFAILSVKLKKL